MGDASDSMVVNTLTGGEDDWVKIPKRNSADPDSSIINAAGEFKEYNSKSVK